jgi:menaquinone-dependent protoporphyrinogen oxidase
MTRRILVAYASRTGTTAEVAEAIRSVLTPSPPIYGRPPDNKQLGEESLEVDVLPMQEVKDLSPYDAVIAGSAIRAARWLPEAMQFIRAHQSALRHKPFAMYTVCITLAMSNGEQFRQGVRDWTAPVRAIVPPLSEGLFAGMIDFKKLPFNWETLKLRATVAMGIFPRGDRRDWNAIRLWAESLKPMLSVPA